MELKEYKLSIYDDIVTYEQALLLKKNGFNEKCLTTYSGTQKLISMFALNTDIDGIIYENELPVYAHGKKEEKYLVSNVQLVKYVSAPTYNMVFNWIEKKTNELSKDKALGMISRFVYTFTNSPIKDSLRKLLIKHGGRLNTYRSIIVRMLGATTHRSTRLVIEEKRFKHKIVLPTNKYNIEEQARNYLINRGINIIGIVREEEYDILLSDSWGHKFKYIK